MSSTSFANKLFNRLDNGLIYDTREYYNFTTLEASGLDEGKIIKNITIDNDNLYFNCQDDKIGQLDLMNKTFNYNFKTSTYEINNGFDIDNNLMIFNYGTTYGCVEQNELYKDTPFAVYKFYNINSDKKILYVAQNGVYKVREFVFEDTQPDISFLQDVDIPSQPNAFINTDYLISVSGDNKLIDIYELETPVNTTTYNLSTNNKIVFADDSIFCYYDKTTHELYKLSVDDYKNSTNKESLNWSLVSNNITNIDQVYITNKWFAYTDGNIINYVSTDYFNGYNGQTGEYFTQMDLLYNINKKLDILTDLLEQFKVPEN